MRSLLLALLLAALWAAPCHADSYTFNQATGSSGVTSFTGDGTLITNSGSTGPVTVTLGTSLPSTIHGSSLTSVGTLAGLTVTAAPIFSAMTAGSVLFADTNGLLNQNNSNLFWNNSNNRLGILVIPSYPLDVGGDARVQHIICKSSTPGFAIGAAAGTGATGSVVGTDTMGIVTVTTAGTPTTSAIICTITFAASFANAPQVIIVPANGETQTTLTKPEFVTVSGVTNAHFTLLSGTTALPVSTFAWYYLVIGSN